MHSRSILTTATIAASLFAVACGKKSAPAGPPMGGTPEVSIITIQPTRVALTTEVAGRVAASLTAEVRPQVGGIVQNRLFTEGSDVKAGEVLYQIDAASYEAAVAAAQAALAKAEANLSPVRLRADRYKDLMASEAVSIQDYDDALAALKLTEAEIAAARAALDSARIQLAYTKITAPISGRIGRSAVTNGALVTAGQASALATIQQLDPVYVDVTQSSSELLQLRKFLNSGQLTAGENRAAVSLILDDDSPYPLPGVLKFSEAFVGEGTGSVTLRTSFPNPDLVLLPGMFTRAILQEGTQEQGILVPQRAVTRNPAGKATVMTVSQTNHAEPRIIEVQRTVGDQWLVSGGLHPGDQVILEGLQKARPGTPVTTVPFVETTAPAAAPAAPKH